MNFKSKYVFSPNPNPEESRDLGSDFSSEYIDAVDAAYEKLLDDEIFRKLLNTGKIDEDDIKDQLYEIVNDIFSENPEAYAGEEQDDDNSWIHWFDSDKLGEIAADRIRDRLPFGESHMKEEVEIKKTKGSATAKVRKLQKQYNKILVDLFDQFAAESIEEALEGNEGSFGENINDIVQSALDNLKTKVLDELGVKSGVVGEIGIAIGGGDMADFMGGAEEELSGEEEGETEAHEEGESEAWEAGEQAAGDDDEEEKDDKKDEKKDDKAVEEKVSSKVSYLDYLGSNRREQIISESRRSDQVSLTDIYTSMYKK